MQIYICDDEQQILIELSDRIRAFMPESKVSCFLSGAGMLQQLKQSHCDVLLLDIDMPELSGMDIARYLAELQEKPLLVFVTSHDELVYESLQYHPFGFIRKTFLENELGSVLKDCREELDSRERHFSFHMSGTNINLLLSDILYFEADGNYLKLYTGDELYRFRSTVQAVENSLFQNGFIRIHKGFLVNQAAIRILKKDNVELVNGHTLPIGKSYAQSAKRDILRYMRL